MRYSMLPNEINALWGIELNPLAAPEAHVKYVAERSGAGERLATLVAMLRGQPSGPLQKGRR